MSTADRLDGFVSVRVPFGGGDVRTVPLRFSGRSLALNFSTSAAGGMRVELQEASGRTIEGFSLDDCDGLFGDTVDRSVTRRGNGDVASLAGKVVRLKFSLKDADLFAFQFVK